LDTSIFSSTDPELTVISGLFLLLLGLVFGAVGGAIGGIIVGGKALGNELAAMMGAFFGPVASAPGVLIGLIVLALIL
jgi:hypothetical protein